MRCLMGSLEIATTCRNFGQCWKDNGWDGMARMGWDGIHVESSFWIFSSFLDHDKVIWLLRMVRHSSYIPHVLVVIPKADLHLRKLPEMREHAATASPRRKIPVILGVEIHVAGNQAYTRENEHGHQESPYIVEKIILFQSVIFSVPLLVFGSVISSTVITNLSMSKKQFFCEKTSQSLARPSQNCPWMPWQRQSSVYWCIISVDYMPGRGNPNGNITMKKNRCECGTVDGSAIRRSPVGI